jgi:hypothetical protein
MIGSGNTKGFSLALPTGGPDRGRMPRNSRRKLSSRLTDHVPFSERSSGRSYALLFNGTEQELQAYMTKTGIIA